MTNIENTKGHRHRLKQKFLENSTLSDYELLELLLTYALPRIDVKPLAKNLINKFGSLRSVIHSDIKDLMNICGIKENSAILIKTINDIIKRDFITDLQTKPIFDNFENLENYLKISLSNKKNEEFHILYLNKIGQLLDDDCHSTGTIDWVSIYPRNITKKALNLEASNIILVHNHPTPNTSFSNEDILITKNLEETLKFQNIKIIDHLLISGTVIYSAKKLLLI